MSYTDFAYVYDALMGDANYPSRTEYILNLFKKFDRKPTLLLDVACGTGGFSIEFAKSGIEVIGTDMSEDMLSIAREKTAEEGLDILYLCQKTQELDLYGTVDGAVCCMDSINHITNPKTLETALKKISLFLEPERLFIFDVNTLYKHEKILANNTFVLDEEDIYCVWQNEFDSENRMTNISLDFFTKEDDIYLRSGEEFSEKAYTSEELKVLLEKAGFKIEAVFGDMSQNPPSDTEERVFYICRKI
ncbi:MAG: class I SAM-dependent methyltransferase [Clostridia bacterium]|nr:class I SAM-dependent methyltransferase [Clostridia bacterium]